jgi:hypothetical protein
MAWPNRRKDDTAQKASSAESFADQVRELARDLVTLEVNTIVKSNMTAERMPTIPNALLEIVRDYVKVFRMLRADVTRVFEHDPNTQVAWRDVPVELVPIDAADVRFFELSDEISFGPLFERLRWAAKNTRYAFIKGNVPISEENLYLLERLENNADTLRTLLDNENYKGLRDGEFSSGLIRTDQVKYLPPFEGMTARDHLIVRKIWEIGVDQVVAQTSIQLDGDVVTRVARQLTTDRERAEQVLMVHQQGIHTSVGNWRAIIDAAVAVVGGLTGHTDRRSS